MLAVEEVDAFYGAVQVLRGLSFEVRTGEVLCLLGRNGAGKTTAMRTVMGLVPVRSGRIVLDEEAISGLAAEEIPKRGIGYVPQGRRLFSELTVRENLEVGLMTRGSGKKALDRALGLFPRLEERLGQRAGTLSGGEQTMLSIARALCIEPRVLLLDEPTEGLMPSMIAAIREVIVRLRGEGVAVVLVEQRVEAVLGIADRVAFMEGGSIRALHSVAEVRADPGLVHTYVGV
ncbi:LIV-I protein F [Hartmannibacter diazotrophicus]|uniref:LIV-I protein F n=1 Tax=Hartmannibacter diazotrophicus TaxID=1482074 RepID=A0A2C9DC60_9HYPH|nr:ABC transporter ATP-binding protein [Hartmannibacter diazotrophicus]SON57846.1 LIV-I protein F [Hartmannibacter diazotrophicus]